jgi:hypothetical protein
LESILRQKLKPNKIILWLSSEELNEKKLPDKLLKLQKRGLTIKFVRENIKSYKKLIYSLKHFKKSLIITIDDDTIYPNYFILKLYEKHKKNKHCIVAYRCSKIIKKNDQNLMPYKTWPRTKNDKESFDNFATGCGGVLYPPGSLNRRVFLKKVFLEDCPYGDDIWFKAMGLLNQTKTAQVFQNSIEFLTITNSQKKALHKINNGPKNENDKQFKKVFDRYDLYKYINN